MYKPHLMEEGQYISFGKLHLITTQKLNYRSLTLHEARTLVL